MTRRDTPARRPDDGEVRWSASGAEPTGAVRGPAAESAERLRDVHISLERLEVPCRIGVTAEERREARTLLVDVRLTPLGGGRSRGEDAAPVPGGMAPGYAADDLAETIDYGEVAAVALATAAERPYRLLERLATEIADRLWAGGRLAELAVAVRKPDPPVGAPAEAACVEVRYRS